MLRLVIVLIFLCVGFAVQAQDAVNHEPTSATDGGVKLQKTKKFRFQKSTRASKTENHGEPVKPSRVKAEVRETERHGKAYRKNRASKKLNGEARVYKKHGASASSAGARKSKVRRSLGRD